MSTPTFDDFGTIDSTTIFHRRDVRNIEIDEKGRTITWFFRAGAEVEVNGKTWIAKDDRARIAKKYSDDEDFQTVHNALSEFDKMEEEEFRIHNSKYTFFKKEEEDKRNDKP